MQIYVKKLRKLRGMAQVQAKVQ